MTQPTLQIQRISDLAFGMAISRAIETERTDANFRDPYARMLGGQCGEAFLEGMGGSSKGAGHMLAVRTTVIDELLLEVIELAEIDTVLNLAAGLDTRPYRMSLPKSLRWIEVDLPQVIEYKTKQLAEVESCCALESISLDLTEQKARKGLFDRINRESSKVLIITEGLLAYLSETEVGELATDLYQCDRFTGWITDLASPLLLNMTMQTWGEQFTAANAALKFAPETGANFFRSYGWEPQTFRLFLEEARRLNRDVPFGWLLRKVPQLLNDGVALLGRS
ncbi:class I SAM-dependent methyltransferase [Leptolyngbya sp. AN03gr2]|uniref:class I SAM-dependent methyltransferase n=1 Tax=unclassified Leptolyngbya TaxID=2650499 RepID=UPI003D3117D4